MTVDNELVLGVDGGGSKTCVWVGRVTKENSGASRVSVLGKAKGGPSNVRALGFQAALANVGNAISEAFANAGMEQVAVARACISLAGAGRAEEQARVIAWARQAAIANDVHAAGDAEIVLAAAFVADGTAGAPAGISLIAGTGSMAWGRNTDQEQVRCGGWGYLFDDEGSAFDIGRQALQLACRTADGRDSADDFCRHLLSHLKLSTPEQLIEWCYASQRPRERIASLAPFVFSQADADERVADILSHSAKSLAMLVNTAARKLRFENASYRLACAGSVLVQQPEYLAAVLSQLERFGLLPGEQRVAPDPVAGALHLAAFMA